MTKRITHAIVRKHMQALKKDQLSWEGALGGMVFQAVLRAMIEVYNEGSFEGYSPQPTDVFAEYEKLGIKRRTTA